MENIILSLLLIKSMTVYEMKMFIGQTLSGVCSDSLGSIQAAIKNLLKKNCIEVNEFTENHVTKKQYRIKDSGLKQFKEWIRVPMDLQKVRNMEDGKFFFLGMAPHEDRIHSLEGYLESMRAEQEKLLQIKAFVESTEDSTLQTNMERIRGEEDELEQYLLQASEEQDMEQVLLNIMRYQLYNLEFGLKRLENDIAFYQSILDRELKPSGAEA